MKFCTHCGKELCDEAAICVACGALCNDKPAAPAANNASAPAANDAPSFGYALLGFLIPLIGLILWLVEKDKTPLRAKSAGKGALVGTILSVVFYIIYIVIMVVLVGTMDSGYYY